MALNGDGETSSVFTHRKVCVVAIVEQRVRPAGQPELLVPATRGIGGALRSANR